MMKEGLKSTWVLCQSTVHYMVRRLIQSTLGSTVCARWAECYQSTQHYDSSRRDSRRFFRLATFSYEGQPTRDFHILAPIDAKKRSSRTLDPVDGPLEDRPCRIRQKLKLKIGRKKEIDAFCLPVDASVDWTVDECSITRRRVQVLGILLLIGSSSIVKTRPKPKL